MFIVPNMLLASEDIKQKQNEWMQYNIALLPSVNTIARGMFCGA